MGYDRRKTRKYSTAAKGMRKHRISGPTQRNGWDQLARCREAENAAERRRVMMARRKLEMFATVKEAFAAAKRR